MKFLLASSKTTIDSKYCSAGFGTTFRGTDGYQKAGTSSLKSAPGLNFTIIK
jgi:hypothetical protein